MFHMLGLWVRVQATIPRAPPTEGMLGPLVVVTVLPPLKPIKEINRRFTLGFKLLGFWLASRKIGRLGS